MSGLSKRATHKAPASRSADTWLDPETLPDVYAMRVAGNCMEPEFPDGALLHIDKREPVSAGDVVVFYRRPERVRPGGYQVQVKRLAWGIPEGVTFPWTEHPESTLHALAMMEQLSPPRLFPVPCEDILAVHKVMGLLREDQAYQPGSPA